MRTGDEGLAERVCRGLEFCAEKNGVALRSYQRMAGRAIVRSVWHRYGKRIVVMFPRQSGKNELQAQIEAYLLFLFSEEGGEIVKVSPTLQPQARNAMRRLERTLEQSTINPFIWKKEAGNIYRIGAASCQFLSGSPNANIVGMTASLLLEVDEAQDIAITKYDREIAPMAASTNATRVFWGTAWDDQTLLARELRSAKQLEKELDEAGYADWQCVFLVNAEEVMKEVPQYKTFVDEQISRYGRYNPIVRSQYFSELVGSDDSMFPEERLRHLEGSHLPLDAAVPDENYVFLIDVAGSDETRSAQKTGDAVGERDATALTICRAIGTDGDDLLRWQCVARRLWINLPLVGQFERIQELVGEWKPGEMVVDATGIGGGLASMLLARYGKDRVTPFTFSLSSKSELGWKFISLLEAGRWQDYQAPGVSVLPILNYQLGESLTISGAAELKQRFLREMRFCKMNVLAGAGQNMRWGVPQGQRDLQTGDAIHDDLLISATLISAVRARSFNSPQETIIMPARDPIKPMRARRKGIHY